VHDCVQVRRLITDIELVRM